MSQAALARDLGMHERTVRYTLSAMVERGHLHTKRRGKMETNLYHLALKNADSDRQPVADHDRQSFAAHSDGVTGKNQQSDRQKSAKVTGNPCPPNPYNEPLEEPIEGKTPPKRESIPKTRRRKAQTPWPDGFHLGDEQAEHAEHKAGWDLSRAFAEFERFQNYHIGKGSAFADWNAAWRMWVQNGAKFDKERAQNQAGGTVIDNEGNVVNFPGGSSRPQPSSRPPWRRRSNTDLAFEEDGDDE
jgi:hypothetical protein